MNVGVHPHHETREHAAGQNVVMILERQAVRPFAGVGFFFGEQIGHQKAFPGKFGKVEAEFEFAHHVNDEGVFTAG
ncbi:MAG: hypothetical protein RBT80_10940 [Candidatus Vecturithrix sp.]|nr:hypothetical protein [Candidatus Vecturithrix sp.]